MCGMTQVHVGYDTGTRSESTLIVWRTASANAPRLSGAGQCSMWDSSSPPCVGQEAEVSAREHPARTRGALIKPVRTNSRKGSGSMAGYAQSPRVAHTEATGNGLEASA